MVSTRRIAQARNEADLTQQQLAERIGIETAQTISRYERGETEVSTKRLRRIAEATRKPLEFFITVPAEARAATATQAELLQGMERLESLLQEILRRLPGDEAEPAAVPRS